MRALAVIAVCFLIAAPLAAQKDKRDPLTDAQSQQIAEAGIDPVARVDLYVKFITERSDTINGLIKRARGPSRARRIDDELQDFSALMDELGENLDVLAGRKADLRRSLKGLNDGIARWQGVLRDLPSEPAFEVSLKEAIGSSNDLADQAKQIAADQDAYFNAHPEQKDQDRYEPK